MKEELLGRPRHLIPQRICASCDTRRDVLHLTKIGRSWLCAPCHRQLASKNRNAQLEGISELDRSDQPMMSPGDAIRLADNAYRFTGIAIKLAFYGVIYGMSTKFPFLLTALAGCFLADVVTWVLGSWFDLQFHRKAVFVEFALYCTAALALQKLGVLTLPEDPGERGIMGISFMVALAVKLLLEGRKIFLGTDQEGW